jgi:hypothetical protein
VSADRGDCLLLTEVLCLSSVLIADLEGGGEGEGGQRVAAMIISAKETVRSVDMCCPTLEACGPLQKLILSPLRCHLVDVCCDDADHTTNWSTLGSKSTMITSLEKKEKAIKNLCCTVTPFAYWPGTASSARTRSSPWWNASEAMTLCTSAPAKHKN